MIKKPPIGVVLVGVYSLILGLFILLSHKHITIIPFYNSLISNLLALFFIATGIFILKFENWARVSFMFFLLLYTIGIAYNSFTLPEKDINNALVISLTLNFLILLASTTYLRNPDIKGMFTVKRFRKTVRFIKNLFIETTEYSFVITCLIVFPIIAGYIIIHYKPHQEINPQAIETFREIEKNCSLCILEHIKDNIVCPEYEICKQAKKLQKPFEQKEYYVAKEYYKNLEGLGFKLPPLYLEKKNDK